MIANAAYQALLPQCTETSASMNNSKFGQRTFDQLCAISLDWLYLDTRLPLVGIRTDLAGCSKLVHVKGCAPGGKFKIADVQDTVAPIFRK